MEKTLAYLRETLSNYVEKQFLARHIYEKIINIPYENEESFVRDLTEEESAYLNHLLKVEMRYAQQQEDMKRLNELNNVYEQLL